jgi:FkbM family methyltransferase
MDVREAFFQIRKRSRSIVDPMRYFVRMVQYVWISALDKTATIRLAFGGKTFLMRIKPAGPREGSRGIFVFREQYEPLLSFGDRFAKPGDVMLDLGANQGIYCCAFGAAVGPSGRVIAVEPIPRQAQRLNANIALNGFDHCTALQKAISDRPGTATLGIAHGDTAASIVAEDNSVSIQVETTSVDEIVSQFHLSRVDFIKLDVEGAEKLALLGAADTLRKFRPTLCLEASDPDLLVEINDLIKDLGYRLFVIQKDGFFRDATGLKVPEDNVIAIARPEQAETLALTT